MMLVKEELVQYLTRGYIHVSRQDFLFFNNLIKIAEEKRVTTGQDKLLNKLIDKYKRQLVKEKLDVNHLKNLRWNHELVETKVEYQQAELKLVDDQFVLRLPFNRKFITELNRLNDDKFFYWDKAKRMYFAPANNLALKNILPVLLSCFQNIILCDKIKEIIQEIKQYENNIWEPTLVERNGNYYIAACNEILYEQIKNLELNDNSITLYALSKLGVCVENKLLDTPEKVFASNYFANVDTSEAENVATWIKNLGKNSVFTRNVMAPKGAGLPLHAYGIKVSPFQDYVSDLHDDSFLLVMRNYYSFYDMTGDNKQRYSFGKIISIKNSNPILVK